MHTVAPKYDPTSATKYMCAKSSKQFQKLLPKCSILSTEVVKKAYETIGERTFGKILKGWYKPCANITILMQNLRPWCYKHFNHHLISRVFLVYSKKN